MGLHLQLQSIGNSTPLTVARARGAIALCCNHETTLDHLEGLVPVTADWHARMALLKVLYSILLRILYMNCITSFLMVFKFRLYGYDCSPENHRLKGHPVSAEECHSSNKRSF